MHSKLICAVVLLLAGTSASAQGGDALPSKLEGKWTVVGNAGVFVDNVIVMLDRTAVGAVAGRLSWTGIGCGTKDEPFTGNWDGKQLTFEAALTANNNTRRANANCAEGKSRFVLTRMGSKFEGTAVNSAGVSASLSLSP